MNTYARWAVAAIAVVLAVGGAAYFLAPAGSQVGGPPTASASPTPALPLPSPSVLASEGELFPGTYIAAFDPSFGFSVDREVEHNCVSTRCRGTIDVNSAGWLSLEFGQPRIELQVIRLDKVNDPAQVGGLIDPPTDLTAWIASRPGVTVLAQQGISVGGLDGSRLDVRTGTDGVEFGPIPGVTDVAAGIPANWVARLYVVEVNGQKVLMILHAEDGSMQELQPLVDSIVWN